jgi:hypothetical protein
MLCKFTLTERFVKQVHSNVCVGSVVVTPTLDWKLHAFDVLSEYDAGTPGAEGPGAPPMLVCLLIARSNLRRSRDLF